MTGSRPGSRSRSSIDWWSVAIYAVLVLMGWLNLYAAIYNEAHPSIFDLSQRYGMQIVWIGISAFLGLTIMLIDEKYYHMLAYPAYWMGIAVLAAVLVFGREVNGAKAWIFIGNNAIQPAEFVKFTTSLAVARYMSRYAFRIDDWRDLLRLAAFIMLPVAIILLQNDAGSAVVYGAFLIVLYREGLNQWIYIVLFMCILLFVLSFLLAPVTILAGLIAIFVLIDGMRNGRWKDRIIFLGAIGLATLGLYSLLNVAFGFDISAYTCLLISAGVSLIFAVMYAYRKRLRSSYALIRLFVVCVLFSATTDYAFDNLLQTHQQKRILDLLGIEADTQHWGYNVDQSKIAIGSGGVFGKGFLNGTQTRFDFVPEQSTDFIFCTVGEEWGFAGSSVVAVLFCLLILRLMKMGERQREPFGRIYCYCVAAIFFVHVVINIGMTIGIMPVIGIPLPFFSYGGSSFLAFTLLFFVALRLDAGKRELMRH